MRQKVQTALLSLVGTEVTATNGVLSAGRQLGAYVLAADFIDLQSASWDSWLSALRTKNIGSHGRYKSLVGTCLDSPHNWGTFACASLTAADLYLGDAAAVKRDYDVLRGYADRTAYAGFEQISSTWNCPNIPFTPTNAGCPTDTVRYGAFVKDVMRGATYPTYSSTGLSYHRECLQGVALTAELLYRAGYTDAWEKARPGFDFGMRTGAIDNHATGYYIPWMSNKRLGYNRPLKATGGAGRVFSYTDWLFQ